MAYPFPISDELEIVHWAIRAVDDHRTPGGDKEHAVTRYVEALIRCIFTNGRKWTSVSQKYTENGKIPDIVLEVFRREEGLDAKGMKNGFFVPRVYVELKSRVGDPTSKALEQAKEAVRGEHGKKFEPAGYIITVRGFEWLFIEYRLGTEPTKYPLRSTKGEEKQKESIVVNLCPLEYKSSMLGPPKDKPEPPRSMGTASASDINSCILDVTKDFDYIVRLLLWICGTRGKLVRNFGENVLPREFSNASINSHSSMPNLFLDLLETISPDEVNYEAEEETMEGHSEDLSADDSGELPDPNDPGELPDPNDPGKLPEYDDEMEGIERQVTDDFHSDMLRSSGHFSHGRRYERSER